MTTHVGSDRSIVWREVAARLGVSVPACQIAALAVVLLREDDRDPDRICRVDDHLGGPGVVVGPRDDLVERITAVERIAGAAETRLTCGEVALRVGIPGAMTAQVAGWDEVRFVAGDAVFTDVTGRLGQARARLLRARVPAVLDGLMTGAARTVGDILPYGAADECVIAGVNETGAPLPQGQTVLDEVGRWALRTPQALAICGERRSLTYGQLAAMANRFSDHLRAAGVRKGSRVGVWLLRTVEFVATALAIWQLGAVVVPTDPAHPPERIRYQLALADVTLIVCSDRLPVDGVPRCHLPGTGSLSGTGPLRPGLCCADDPAYILFTSGSTGRPKGAALTHHAIRNLGFALGDLLGLCTADRFAAIITFAFDVSVAELFAPLVLGASAVMAGESVVVDPARLARWLGEQRITVAQATVTQWRQMLPYLAGNATALHAITCGEVLRAREAEALRSVVRSVWNLYGPTEATVHCTGTAVAVGAGDPLSVGAPLRNDRVEILDPDGRRLPVGHAGELHLGGAGLAMGYVGDPARTEAAFVDHPRYGRLYRSGDLGRWLPDGEIEFLGRADRQVQLHGYRVELGEIEAVAERHPAVRRAAVVVAGGSMLTLWVQTRPEDELTGRALRVHLAERLPIHMIPRTIRLLDRLPLTANNKVDRLALSERD